MAEKKANMALTGLIRPMFFKEQVTIKGKG